MPAAAHARTAWFRYAVALAAVAAALGLRAALDPWLGGRVPYITLFGAVIVAAWFGGFGPGVVAAFAGFVGADLLFIEPRGTFTIASTERAPEMAAYLLSAGLIAALGGARQAARLRAETSEQRLRAFMENSPAAVLIKDEGGKYVFMNPAAEKIVGTRDWRGKSARDLLPAAAASDVEEHDRQVLAADAPASFDLAIEREGGRRYHHNSKFVLRDANGSRLLGSVVVDVTEQTRTAEELRLQREQLRLVTDTIGAGVVRVSADLKYLWVNRVFASWIGKTPADIIGRPIVEVVGEDGLRELRPYAARLLAGERVDYERLARFPRIGQRWIHSVAEPTFDDSGVANGWVAVVSDVHDRREADAALEAAREQLQLVADSMPAAVALCSRDLRYVWVNRRCAEWLGMEPREVVGRPLGEIIGRDNLAAIRPYIDRVLAGEQVTYERLVHYRGLGERWVRNFFAPTRGGSGWITVIADIHDSKLMEQALREAERRKDEFLATLAHELRNPLAPIRNALEILRLARDDPVATQKAREMMQRQVHQMVRLVDDLIDVSRITTGKLAVKKGPLDLRSVLRDSVEIARPFIDSRRHALELRVPDEALPVEGDATRLGQVFSNLLNNSAKYTDPGGRIELAAAREGDEVVVSVRDNGIGLDPACIEQIFDMFVQVDRALDRTQAGLGVGLTLARRLVELHDGRIEARSPGRGHGSEFIVRLPASFARMEQAPGSLRSEASRPGGRRVLLADDNEDFVDSMGALLASRGHEVRIAYNGAQALEMAREFRPEVAFLDIGMPRVHGYEVARRMRADPATARCLLVAVTGWGQENDRARARDAGFDRHLVKPVDPAEIAAILEAQAAGNAVLTPR